MCRLFGFRSVLSSQVHNSLLEADNALGVQSNEHPDGWGVAFYVDGSPHLTRSPTTALSDQLFHRLSGVVSSQTVVAHVRKATQGSNNVLNCHPFQHGRWVFAHNGDIPDFESHRQALMAMVAPTLRRFILGDTDSELMFHILLSQLHAAGDLGRPITSQELINALRVTMEMVRRTCETPEQEAPCLLTFIVTNGETLAACHGGKELFFSTHKTRCSDRDTCSYLSPECEAPSTTGYVNHFILSSEPLQGENVWTELVQGDMVAVDARMHFIKTTSDRVLLPVAHA